MVKTMDFQAAEHSAAGVSTQVETSGSSPEPVSSKDSLGISSIEEKQIPNQK